MGSGETSKRNESEWEVGGLETDPKEGFFPSEERSIDPAAAGSDSEFTKEERQQVKPDLLTLSLNELITTEEAFSRDVKAAGEAANIASRYLAAKPDESTPLLTKEQRHHLFRFADAMKKMHQLRAVQDEFVDALKSYLAAPDQEKAEILFQKYEQLGQEEGNFCKFYDEKKIGNIPLIPAINADKAMSEQVGLFGMSSLLMKPFQHFQKTQVKLDQVIKAMPKTDPRLSDLQQLNDKVRGMQTSVNAQMQLPQQEISTGDVKITLKFDGNKEGKNTTVKQMGKAKDFLSKALEAGVKGTELMQKELTGLTLPSGYTISGKKTSFTVKKGTIPLWEIKIGRSNLIIQELGRGKISSEEYAQQLQRLHEFTHYFYIHIRGPLKLSCPDSNKVKILRGLSDGYQLGKKEEQALLVQADPLKKQTDQTNENLDNHINKFINKLLGKLVKEEKKIVSSVQKAGPELSKNTGFMFMHGGRPAANPQPSLDPTVQSKTVSSIKL